MPTRQTSCSPRSIRPCAGSSYLAPGLAVVLADTVGFVRDLPHELVAAFRSTLQEAREADLLLHVIDAADPERAERIAQVNAVLEAVGASGLPQIEVFNKIDRTGEAPRAEIDAEGRVDRIWLSAHSGQGVELLLAALHAQSRRRPAPQRAAAAGRRGPGSRPAVRRRRRAARADRSTTVASSSR